MKVKQMLLKLCYRSASYVKHNTPTILTVIGAAGVGMTVVSTVQATTKAVKRLDAAKEEKGEDLTKTEIFMTAVPVYVRPIALGTATITCIFCANVLNKRKQASLISAYALLDNAHKEYTGKLKELYGEETDSKIREAIAMDKRNEEITAYAPGLNSPISHGEKVLFYEEFRGAYFEATMNDVLNAEYHLNRNFALRGCANLNEFYEFLGLEKTDFGDTLGWSADEFIESGLTPWIDFDHVLTPVSDDGMECYRIFMEFAPTPGYDIY